MDRQTVVASRMSVGQYGINDDGDIVQRRNNGKQGGCVNDYWLAYIGACSDEHIREVTGLTDDQIEQLPSVIDDTED